MKKNYQKPMCVTVPVRAQSLICESNKYQIHQQSSVNNAGNIGWSRGYSDDDDE